MKDGDALLFVSDAAGNVVDFKVGTDGETAPSNTGGVTVYDRDTAGVVLLTSNASGHSALAPLDSSDLSDPSYPGTSGYQAPSRSFFDTNRADGYNFGLFRINGVRAFDAALGSWTTPDAYAGDVHDPASQQRYMWNRNNPYEYSDPSGYFPEEILADAWGGAQNAASSEAAQQADEGEPVTIAAGNGRPSRPEKPIRPPRPNLKLTNPEYGRIFDWGKSDSPLEQLRVWLKARTMNEDTVRGYIAQGVDRDGVEYWRGVYQREVDSQIHNPIAWYRRELMQSVLDHWPKGTGKK